MSNIEEQMSIEKIEVGSRGQYPNKFGWTVESLQGDSVVIIDADEQRATITAGEAAKGIAALEACWASWAARDALDAEKAERAAVEKTAKIDGWIARLGDGNAFRIAESSDESYSGIRICTPDGSSMVECRAYGIRKEWLGSKSRAEVVEIFSKI